MRSQNGLSLDLKIKDIIQDRYTFNCPLVQCHEPSSTANPTISCVIKNRKEIWGFIYYKFLQVNYWH